MPRNYKPVPPIPSAEDREFIRMVASGEKRARSFRQAYPNHPSVARYMDIVNKRVEPEEGERSRLAVTIAQLAKDKVQTKAINSRLASLS